MGSPPSGSVTSGSDCPSASSGEINNHTETTTVYRAPDYVRGLVNLRGQLVTVLDLGRRLGGDSTDDSDPRTRVLVLKTNAELAGLDGDMRTSDDKMGLLVDRIGDVVMPEAEEIEGVPANLDPGMAPFVAGVCKTDRNTVTILDSQRLVESSRRGQGAQRAPKTEQGELG